MFGLWYGAEKSGRVRENDDEDAQTADRATGLSWEDWTI